MGTASVKRYGFGDLYRRYGILMLFVVEIVIFSLLARNFLTLNNLLVVGRQVSFIGVAAVGGTLLMITGGIDISCGSMLALSGTLCAMMTVKMGVPLPLAIVAVLMVGLVFGVISGVAYTKFHITPLIGTLAMQTILRGIAYLATKANPIYGLSNEYKFMAQGYLFGVLPIPLLIMLLMFAFGYWLLEYSYVGRHIYAVGGNEEAARLSGINTKMVSLFVFAASGFFAAMAGILMSARLGSGQPSIGADFPMDVITGIVLGGVSINGGSGKILSVLTGVLIMGILGNGMIMVGLNEFWQWIVKGVVLLFAVGMSNIYVNKN